MSLKAWLEIGNLTRRVEALEKTESDPHALGEILARLDDIEAELKRRKGGRPKKTEKVA